MSPIDPPNYPVNARYVRDMARRENYRFEDLDQGNGYLFKVSNNKRFFLSGAGTVSAWPINSATAHGIARDKAHTKNVLCAFSLPTVPGRLFFVQTRYAALQPNGHGRDDAAPYARKMGFPIFCKPNAGARGDFAEIIASEAELNDYINRLAPIYDAFLIEQLVEADEYRVLMIDGEPQYQLKKSHPCLIGDGRSTISELVAATNASIDGFGLSPYRLGALPPGFSLQTILPEGERFALPGRRNISSLGSFEHLTFQIDPTLATLAIRAAESLQLRLAAVDIFDLGKDRHENDLRIIEVNSNPSITVLEKAGHYDKILDIWSKIARELLA